MPNELTTPWADREELRALLTTAREVHLRDFLLVALLGLNGLRVSEAVGAAAEHLGVSGGLRTLRVVRKGRRVGVVPLSAAVATAIDDFLEGRQSGPLLARLHRSGTVMLPYASISRQAAYERLKTLAELARVNPALSPHSLRRSFATICLQDGVPLHDVQLAMGHASPTTTMIYHRDAGNLSLNPTFSLAEKLLSSAG